MLQELDCAAKRSRTRAPACAGKRYSAGDHCGMDQWGGDSARQGTEEFEGCHELFPINQKRNVIDIEMLFPMLYRYWTQSKSKSQPFGLMGYHANQARL